MTVKRRKASDWAKKTYKATNSTDCIHALQDLMNNQSAKFEWTTHLDSKEVAFVYDMVSKANEFADFLPSVAQSRWMVAILGKLKLIKAATTKPKKAKRGKSKSKAMLHTKNKQQEQQEAVKLATAAIEKDPYPLKASTKSKSKEANT